MLLMVVSFCFGKQGVYVCPPCGLACDTLFFGQGGSCPNCNMVLVHKADSNKRPEERLQIHAVKIEQGSGKFLVKGGSSLAKTISVHYHRPANFTETSSVLLVLPGAGRNANDYRDAWKQASETYGVLVLALGYPEQHYPGFWSYNLAGMLYDIDFKKETFTVETEPAKWIFNDFDRIFHLVKAALALQQDHYDMFGHSAGGQLLHRYALFGTSQNTNRIVAANSGWYTLPTTMAPFPYGLGKSAFANKKIDFDKKLIIFLGENDNADETRGHLRHGPEVDQQGFHRLERGMYFYHTAKKEAKTNNKRFHWSMEIVPNVGHDYKKMSAKAALLLYDR